MLEPENFAPEDLRMRLYRMVRIVVLAALVGFVIKVALFNTIVILTPQMDPTILEGERVLVGKLRLSAPVKALFGLPCCAPVLFYYPHTSNSQGISRILALAGDTISIEQGALLASKCEKIERTPPSVPLPPEFSPRDNCEQFRIPRPGETVGLTECSLRDFIFYASMAAQENPDGSIKVVPKISQGDTLQDSFTIKTFTLYQGTLDSIPDSLSFDWFFWDRLKAHLQQTAAANEQIALDLELHFLGSPVAQYRVKTPFVFLLGDNWSNSYDSRYIGPVAANRLRGVIRAVIWSRGPAENPGVRLGRLGTLVH